jgi:hypothetical protein
MAKKPNKIQLSDKDNDKSYGGGDQTVYGNGGDDSISGGGGNDKLSGGEGDDILRGGNGDDRLVGGLGDDRLVGGSGDDTIKATSGNDTVDGGAGDDIVTLSGNFADAKVAMDNGYYAITIGDSTVKVKNVETFKFADGTFETADLDEKVTGTSGQTFTLTTAIDKIAGTAGDDVVTAGLSGANEATLNPGDSIVAGDGNDTLNIFNAVNAANFKAASITGVDVVNTQMTGGALDVSGNADVKQAWLVAGSTAANTITLTKAQTAGLRGDLDAVAGIATFAFFDATAGTADSANLAVDGAVAFGVDIDAIETLNLTATGKSALGTVSADSLVSLVVTGAGSVSAKFDAVADIESIDASANTGGVSFDISAVAASDLAIKGSSGEDSITTVFGDLNAVDTIDLGAGSNDTLLFTDDATITSAAASALFAKYAGVEEIGTVSATLAVDGDLVTQTRFSTSGNGGDVAITNAKQGTTVEFGAGAIDASTIAMKLGANTLNIELVGDKNSEADVSNGVDITGSSTINILSKGVAGVADNHLDIDVADNQAIVLTGSQNTILHVDNITGVTGVNIDASAFTGKADIVATGDADVIKGGSAADIIDGDDGADVLTGNGGADTFVIDTTALTFDAAGYAAAADTVTDFVSGTDKLEFGSVAGDATNYLEGAAPVANFAAALAAADAALNGTVDYYAAQVGADVYVFYDADGTLDSAATEVVKLTGVDLSGIAFTDII